MVIIGPNQSVNIKGYIDKDLNFHDTCAILQETEDSALPRFVDVTPSVIQYSYNNNKEVKVNISNITTVTVTISPSAILCELQPVTIGDSVSEKLENELSSKVLEEINIESELSEDQTRQIRDVLTKHINIF